MARIMASTAGLTRSTAPPKMPAMPLTVSLRHARRDAAV
jgi:hypothetical protein